MSAQDTWLVAPDTAAVKKAVNIPKGAVGSSLQLVGADGDAIIIERALVADPVESNDAHWTQLVQEATAKQLDADNHTLTIYGAVNIRINKPITGTAVGVLWVK